jgi:hypothetical protein
MKIAVYLDIQFPRLVSAILSQQDMLIYQKFLLSIIDDLEEYAGELVRYN